MRPGILPIDAVTALSCHTALGSYCALGATGGVFAFFAVFAFAPCVVVAAGFAGVLRFGVAVVT